MLKERFGGRWDGDELDGRNEMERLLRDKLGFSAADARTSIDAMIADGSIRYQRALEAGVAPVPAPVAPPTEGMATGVVSAGTSSLPLASFGRRRHRRLLGVRRQRPAGWARRPGHA